MSPDSHDERRSAISLLCATTAVPMRTPTTIQLRTPRPPSTTPAIANPRPCVPFFLVRRRPTMPRIRATTPVPRTPVTSAAMDTPSVRGAAWYWFGLYGACG
jgi:hypothetical protein